MTQARSIIFIAVLTLAVGYLPSYLHLLIPIANQAMPFKDLGTLQKYDNGPCIDEPESAHGTCQKSYLIPKRLFQGEDYANGVSVSIGLVARSVGIRCSTSSKSYAQSFGSIHNPGLDRSESNRLKVFELRSLDCPEAYIIDAWATRNDSRVGWISGPLLLGKSEAIQRYKLVLDFYLNDLRLVIATLLLTLFLITFISRRSLGDNYIRNGFEEIIASLAFLNLINSGMLSFFVPAIPPFALNALSVFVSTLIPAFVLRVHQTKAHTFIAFAVVSAMLCSSPFQDQWRYAAFFVLPAIALLLTLRERDYTVSWFGIFCCLAALRTIGFEWAPHSHIHSVFGLLAVSAVFFRRIGSLFRSTSMLLQSSKKRTSESLEFDDFWATLTALSEASAGAKVSVFAIHSGTACDYYSYERGHKTTDKFESLPPVVAHSTSTGTPRFHLPVDSEEFRVIIGASSFKNPNSYDGKHVTMFPSRHSNGSVYVVTITNYRDSFTFQRSEAAEFEQNIRLATPTIVETLAILSDRGRTQLLESLRDARSKIISKQSETERHELIPFLSKSLGDSIECRHIIFKFNDADRSLTPEQFFGFPETSIEYLKTTQFFAKIDNLQGPSALAMNTKTPVAVEDVRWLKQVLKEKTYKHFLINNTNSCLAIPIITSDGAWGIVWLESSVTGFFRGDLRSEYSDLMLAIGARTQEAARSTQALIIEKELSKFVPKEATEKLKAGLDPKEKDFGLLMMVDLKGSTSLSMRVGAETYQRLIDSLAVQLSKELHDWKLQDVRWDAFFLTLTEPEGLTSVMRRQDLETISNRVQVAFQAWVGAHPIELAHTQTTDFRVCVTKGDTSRDVVRGNTMHWTITGPSMAVIHKIEAVAKTVTGDLFIDLNSIAVSTEVTFSRTVEVSNPAIEVGVIELPRSNTKAIA